MPIIGIRFGQMPDNGPDSIGVRSRCRHAILRLAQFRRSDHFHGPSDLLRVLDAIDLGAKFFADSHDKSLVRARRFEVLDNGFQFAPDFVVQITAGVDLLHQFGRVGASVSV